jgi:N-acetylated-alpha-linked acidic dipeptidase
LSAGGSHALQPFVDEIAKNVIDPQTNVSVYERWKANKATTEANTKAKKDALTATTMDLGALGSGSDYSPFLQHLGLPSLNIGFGGEDGGGEYHSIYDSYDDYRRFKDPGFEYGVALAKTAGHAVLRMADADMLPFDYSALSKTINNYATELINLTNDMRDATSVENQLLKQNDYRLAADPTKTFIAPKPKDEVPFLDFSPLQNAVQSLKTSTDTLTTVLKKMSSQAEFQDNINLQLFHAEQQLLLPNGLPGRSWYMHSLYAPGFYTGYGVKTMPGIREAIEQRKWKEAQDEINSTARVIQNLADYLQNIRQ